jgi:hypothetical protein
MSPSVPSPKQLGGEAISPDLVGGLDDIIQGFGKLGPELINGHVTQKEVFLNGGELGLHTGTVWAEIGGVVSFWLKEIVN